jgi:transcriptional regulator with XRE-family HTH domain
MEFNEKLQQLRKQRNLTQEELARILFVSRTAVSKWESGRGYPSIDSLKAIADHFEITVDQLLSGEELLTIARKDSKHRRSQLLDLVFGLLDCGHILLLLLPLFGQKTADGIQAVSLLSLTEIASYLKIGYWSAVVSMTLWGILTLALQNCSHHLWINSKRKLSLLLNILGTILFVISLQPYGATLLFLFLAVKVLLLIKTQ